MKWFSHAIAWILLLILIASAPLLPKSQPMNSHSAPPSDWKGVLRIWICLDWQPGTGSLSPWLNETAAIFERKHPGVFVQITPVSKDRLRTWGNGPALPPDALIISSSVLKSPQGFAALASDAQFASNIQPKATAIAIPIAMGGHAAAINMDIPPADAPGSFSDFVAGHAHSTIVNLRTLHQLARKREACVAPEYSIVPAERPDIDQLALYMLPDQPARPDPMALCRSLLETYLSDAAQRQLKTVFALRVTQGEPLYDAHTDFGILESAY